MKPKSAADVLARVEEDPEFKERLRKDPATALREVAGRPLDHDVWIYRIVVGALGLALVATVLGAIVLAASSTASPEILTALGSGCVGALAGLLAPSPR